MARSPQELKEALDAFTRNCENNLKLARTLCAALENGEMDDIAPTPFHLNIILDKYVELLDTRLIPALGSKPPTPVPTPKRQAPQPVAQEEPPSLYERHTPKTVGKSFAREVIGAQAPKPAAPVTPKAPPHPAAAKPSASQTVTPQAAPAHHVAGEEEEEHTGGARRVIPRYNQRLAVRYTVVGRDKSPIKAFSRDIGAMGLFIVANRLEKSGQTLKIEIDLPEHGKVVMQGNVVWTKWVPPALRTVDYPGFAVRIESAPEAWFSYFMGVEGDHNEAS